MISLKMLMWKIMSLTGKFNKFPENWRMLKLYNIVITRSPMPDVNLKLTLDIFLLFKIKQCVGANILYYTFNSQFCIK
jgi:hypothetical protein